jgi:hypothetical protein
LLGRLAVVIGAKERAVYISQAVNSKVFGANPPKVPFHGRFRPLKLPRALTFEAKMVKSTNPISDVPIA